MDGLRCEKLLWYKFNDTDALPEVEEHTRLGMKEGNLIGEMARTLYSDGELVDVPFNTTVSKTKELMELGKPIFEAAFETENAYCKVDILLPSGDGWEIIEVKKTTRVKAEHIEDVAFQMHVLRLNGVNVVGAKLMHLNGKYVRDGNIDVGQLFSTDDITEKVEEKVGTVAKNINRLLLVIAGPRPEHERVHMCNNHYGCPVSSIDVEELPEYNLTQLFFAKRKGMEMILNGKTLFSELDVDDKLNKKQQIQKDAVNSGKTHVDVAEIKEWLDKLEYPLYYFDFETIGSALPPLDGIKPYEQAPFQFSLHVQSSEGGDLEHVEFLGDGGDPRKDLIEAMKKLGSSGSIIAYNKSFEINCIKRLAEIFPTETWLNDLIPRFVDLMKPFFDFSYYNPLQKGRYSIKKVLPAMTDISYDGMEIAEGGTAQSEYMRITSSTVSDDEQKRVKKALLKYCELDTLAMVKIIDELRIIVG